MSNIINFIELLREHCSKNYNVKIPSIKINNEQLQNYGSAKIIKNNTIQFIREDTLKTAVQSKKSGYKPLVLILADEKVPGGTLISSCQEETLFRRTALISHLDKRFYPLKDNELVYSQNVAVFNLNDFNTDFTEKYSLDFVALPSVKNYYKQIELRETMKIKLHMLFNLYKLHNYTDLILGAMGCGAFGCNANSMAMLIKEVINEYDGMNITFSILGANYNIFKQCFEK